MADSKSATQSTKEAARRAHITVGVLGHVDHGKTSLVRALTGIETDRLKEEKERGLSIVLGYAYHESTLGVIDFIDVPGHENFIRTMISGATGIDSLLLTVAANEGIKPQTEEHFNIAGFLGINKGLVVITKSDMVSQSTSERIRDEVRDFISGTYMDSARIIETSLSDKNSINKLKQLLEEQLLNPSQRKNTGQSYLPLDRVFTMTGFGTVVTGTLRNGTLVSGQEVKIMPRDHQAHIRQLQVHNKVADCAYPGQRVAVNLRNIDKDMIARGDALISGRYLRPTRLLDVELQLVDRIEHPPKYGDIVRVLFGTCEVSAMLRILGGKQLEQGAMCLAQLACLRAVVVPVGERFIVRSMSPVTTLGGGRILDNDPVKHRRSDRRAVVRLQRLASGDMAQVISEQIEAAESRGIELKELAGSVNLTMDDLTHYLDDSSIVFLQSQRLISKSAFDSLCRQALDEIGSFHKTNPNRRGQPLSELRSRLKDVDEVVFRFLVGYLDEHGFVKADKHIVRLRDFDLLQELDATEKKIADEIVEAFKSGDLKPPELNEVLQSNPQRKRLYHLLTETGELVPIQNRDINRLLVFHRRSIEEMVRKLEHAYPDSVTFTVADMRNLVDTSRKFAIPLLEYLDSIRVTIRVGDKRKLNTGKMVGYPESK